MTDTLPSTAPYLSLRHAMTGRIGDDGRLPAGWAGEHTTDVNVRDVRSVDGKPSLYVSFKFGDAPANDFSGLCVGRYLPVAENSVVVLAGQVTVEECRNAQGAFMVLREWREGGEFVRQSMRPLLLSAAPQIGLVAHEVTGKGRVIQPFLMIKRQSRAVGQMTVTLTGLAFGNLYEHPRWLWR